MICVILNITEHIPGQYRRYDEDDNVWIDIDDLSTIPSEDIYSHDGKYGVYQLAVYPRGVFCKNDFTTSLFYTFDSSKSVFELANYIDDNGFQTPEYFSYWQAARRGTNYYLSIQAHVIGHSLVDACIQLVEKWIISNTSNLSRNEFEYPSPLCPSIIPSIDELENQIVSSDEIIRLEINYPSFRELNDIVWEIDYPEFEGGGGTAFIVLSTIEIFLKLCPIAIGSAGLVLALKNMINNLQYNRLVEKARREIYQKYSLSGHLFDPDPSLSHDNDGNRVLVFIEREFDNIIAYYNVTISDNGEYSIARIEPKQTKRKKG